jgi:nucleoside-diphosphate-sugar epimerase
MTLLLTGANGFVGTAVRQALAARGIAHRSAVRAAVAGDRDLDTVLVGDIHGTTDWPPACFEGVSVVMHLAARVHVMRETSTDALSEFRHVNTAGTERLARAAAAARVKRFVYVSSIKVNGESTRERSFASSDPPQPDDPYGISKWEAELVLGRVARDTGLETVIVRPPLVYGPGVKGNFLRLLMLVDTGLPLPLGAARNLRSLVFVQNLADLLVTCAQHPNAAGQTFLVSDDEDLSVADLCTRLARALERPARLLPVPIAVLRGAAVVTRRTQEFQRLFGSLRIDSSPLQGELGWSPPVSVDDGIVATATWFRGR